MNEIEIYWKDLTKETQNRLLELWGDNGYYDVFPLAVLSMESEEAIEPEKQIRVLKVEPGCPPCEKVIGNDLKSIQAEVQGHFECVYLPNHVILCCNEEGYSLITVI